MIDWIQNGAQWMFDWIVEPILNGILTIIDLTITGILYLMVQPLITLFDVLSDTQFFNAIVTALTDPNGGLPYLVNTITILDHLLNWQWIIGTLAICFIVTFAMLIFKVIVKIIPTVW